jgi:hypothetical protein
MSLMHRGAVFLSIACLSAYSDVGNASEICHSAMVSQGPARTPVRFCVDPDAGSVTDQSASSARVNFRERRTGSGSIDGVMVLTLRPGDLPLRVTSKFLLDDRASGVSSLRKKGDAVYEVCSWNIAGSQCARPEVAPTTSSCWRPCATYQYTPGVVSVR